MTTITRFEHPASLDAAEMFVLRAERDLWATVLLEIVGDLDMDDPAEMSFAFGTHPQYHRHIRLVASDRPTPTSGRDVIGVATLDLPMADNLRLADLSIAVRPDRRGEGVGSLLHAEALELGRGLGRTTFQSWSWERPHPPGGGSELSAESGSGSVDASSPHAQFLTGLGYVLGQVESISRLQLPERESLSRQRRTALATTPAGYEVFTHHGPTPEELLDDVAFLSHAMASDVPTGAMDLEDEAWDAARVRDSDDQWELANRDQVQTFVRHHASGHLVGFTRLFLDKAHPEVAHQWETLVVGGHRGHGLGMLMKIVNHAAAAVRWPEVSRLITGNASENSHMRAINTALGYSPYAASGFWELRDGALG